MELNPAVVLKELVDQSGLMGREVVEADVNLLVGRALRDDFFEEGNEVLPCVASGGFAVHAASGCFQRGEQRQRSVAVIFETVSPDPSWRERQYGIEPVQSLNGGLSSTQKTAACSGGFK